MSTGTLVNLIPGLSTQCANHDQNTATSSGFLLQIFSNICSSKVLSASLAAGVASSKLTGCIGKPLKLLYSFRSQSLGEP